MDTTRITTSNKNKDSIHKLIYYNAIYAKKKNITTLETNSREFTQLERKICEKSKKIGEITNEDEIRVLEEEIIKSKEMLDTIDNANESLHHIDDYIYHSFMKGVEIEHNISETSTMVLNPHYLNSYNDVFVDESSSVIYKHMIMAMASSNRIEADFFNFGERFFCRECRTRELDIKIGNKCAELNDVCRCTVNGLYPWCSYCLLPNIVNEIKGFVMEPSTSINISTSKFICYVACPMCRAKICFYDIFKIEKLSEYSLQEDFVDHPRLSNHHQQQQTEASQQVKIEYTGKCDGIHQHATHQPQLIAENNPHPHGPDITDLQQIIQSSSIQHQMPALITNQIKEEFDKGDSVQPQQRQYLERSGDTMISVKKLLSIIQLVTDAPLPQQRATEHSHHTTQQSVKYPDTGQFISQQIQPVYLEKLESYNEGSLEDILTLGQEYPTLGVPYGMSNDDQDLFKSERYATRDSGLLKRTLESTKESDRHCSFCGEPGHYINTCKSLPADRKAAIMEEKRVKKLKKR